MTFQYPASVVRVIDGDTLILDVDLGFNVWVRNQSFRLLGLNAREKSEAGGREAKEHLAALVPPGTPVTLTSVKPDKFGGRYDALLGLANGRDLAETLIAEGWAAAWDGNGTKPSPTWPRPMSR